jgi:hypothetical protein
MTAEDAAELIVRLTGLPGHRSSMENVFRAAMAEARAKARAEALREAIGLIAKAPIAPIAKTELCRKLAEGGGK